MKKMICRTKRFVALLAAGCVLFQAVPLKAQEKVDPANKPAVSGGGSNELSTVTNSPDTNAVMSNVPAAPGSEEAQTDKWKSEINREAVVVFGKNAELKSNESADTVVVIGGSAKVSGKVRDTVVAIGGDVEIQGEVGDTAVAVMGSVKLGQGAVVHGDVVSVGGHIDVAHGATINGKTQEIDFSGTPLSRHLQGLKNWFVHCVLKFRLLAPQVGWVWAVAGAFFLLYLLITVTLPKPVAACVDEMTRRPISTFFIGLLVKLVVPLVVLVLIATGLGIVVVPFIQAALLVGALIGKAALLQYLGRQIGRQFGSDAIQKPLLAFLVGWILITLLYMVPILSLLVFAVTSIWGIGVAITATFGGLRRESPPRPAAPAPSPAFAVPAMATGAPPAIGTEAGTQQTATQVPPPLTAPAPAILPPALAYPKAGFWERMAAAFLDLVLVGILSSMARGIHGPPLGFLVALAYFAGMWAWKGTTLGGIVLKLQVVRHDGGGPVTFLVALVRALAAAFSAVVFFLGFFWIAWDRDKQGWHDKIAGTVVVRLPRGTPLVCI